MEILSSPKDQAKKMINIIYQPMGFLNCCMSSNQMWSWAKERTLEQIELLISQIPMYVGELNPKWKFWDEVRTELRKM